MVIPVCYPPSRARSCCESQFRTSGVLSKTPKTMPVYGTTPSHACCPSISISISPSFVRGNPPPPSTTPSPSPLLCLPYSARCNQETNRPILCIPTAGGEYVTSIIHYTSHFVLQTFSRWRLNQYTDLFMHPQPVASLIPCDAHTLCSLTPTLTFAAVSHFATNHPFLSLLSNQYLFTTPATRQRCSNCSHSAAGRWF